MSSLFHFPMRKCFPSFCVRRFAGSVLEAVSFRDGRVVDTEDRDIKDRWRESLKPNSYKHGIK